MSSAQLSSANSWTGETLATLLTRSGTEESCQRFTALAVSASSDQDGTLHIYSGPSGALQLECSIPITGSIRERAHIPISFSHYRVDLENTSGSLATITVQTFLHFGAPGAAVLPSDATGIAAGHGVNVHMVDPVTVDVGISESSDSVVCWAYDGAANRAISCDAAGVVNVAAAAMPLPTGGATSAHQLTQITAEQAIQAAVEGTVKVDGSAVTQPISAVSLPLPADAASATHQVTQNAHQLAIKTAVEGTLVVDGSAVTQPISAVSLPLPALASTAAHQVTQNAHQLAIKTAVEGTLVVDGSAVTQPISAASLPLPALASTAAHQVTQNAHQLAIKTAVEGTLVVDGSAVTQPISAVSLPLPALAAEEHAPVGTHGTPWSAAVLGAAAVSASVDVQYQKEVEIFGNASAMTTITLQVSQDDSNWYPTWSSASTSGSEDFWFQATVSARYVRLHLSDAATVTATVSAK